VVPKILSITILLDVKNIIDVGWNFIKCHDEFGFSASDLTGELCST